MNPNPQTENASFENAQDLLELCEQQQCSIAEIVLKMESIEQDKNSEDIISKLEHFYQSMKESVHKGLKIRERSSSGLSGGDAAKLYEYSAGEKALFGPHFTKAIAYGFAVLEHNAQFGRIIATPTAGSAGIVPACLMTLEDMGQLSKKDASKALLTAAGIGVVIGKNAFFSGARGGCQAEVGSASSMAAAAIAAVQGGSPEQCCNAAAFALMNTLGLVCDPIGGFVEVPCVSRNGMFTIHSFLAATMALSGARCVVPLDDVVIAMRDIGRRLPAALKETSKGGLATCPTGLKFSKPTTQR